MEEDKEVFIDTEEVKEREANIVAEVADLNENFSDPEKIRKKIIRKGVAKVGLITFLIGSIFPMIMTIIFLVRYMPQIRQWSFYLDYYGSIIAGQDFTLLLAYWLTIPIPLTTTNMIGKRLLYADRKELLTIMPILTVGMVIGFMFLCLELSNYFT